MDPALYANGRKAFLDYLPVTDSGLPPGDQCAGAALMRRVSWGREVELFILDERSCRSADVETICKSDLGPTLPPALRALFDGFGLPLQPPPGCLDALFDPERTMLGAAQKARLKRQLLDSTARFKFIINEVPIQQFFALPYDRWGICRRA